MKSIDYFNSTINMTITVFLEIKTTFTFLLILKTTTIFDKAVSVMGQCRAKSCKTRCPVALPY